jgi:hypothetical protein
MIIGSFFASGGVAPVRNRKRAEGKARSQANRARYWALYSAASIRDDQGQKALKFIQALSEAPGQLDCVGIIT